MQLFILVFLFVLFMGLALISNANVRSQARKRDRFIGERLLTPHSSETTVASETPVPSRPQYSGQLPLIRELDQMIAQAGLDFMPGTVIAATLTLFAFVSSIASLWLEKMFAIGAGLALATVPFFVLNFLRARRLRMFSQQLPYLLDLLKSSLESGHSILRALQMAAQNLAEPIASELQKVVEQVRVGVPLPVAIEGMYRRVPVEELGFLAAATRVQAEIGSSLAEILDHVSQSVRTRQRLEAQIHTLTAQARASALIVALLPLVILGVFTLLKPDYAKPLYTDPLGIRLLETAIVFNVVAFVAMRQIARVDY